MKHGPMYPNRVLYPVRPAPNAVAIERAIAVIVERMKPRSLCVCGKFCATHRKLVADRDRKDLK